MKYAKILGLLAVAAAALMAFAASASATTLTSPPGTTYTGVIEAEAEDPDSEEHNGVTLDGVTDINCTHSKVAGKVETHGSNVTASGLLSTLTFEECNAHVTVLKKGELIIHTDHVAGDGNGTLTSSGAEVTIQVTTPIKISCIYSTENTPIGTLTGHDDEHATLDIKATIKRTGHSFFCGAEAEWTGSYTVTNPENLTVD
jgi:opacity protein-like surface antigen